MAVDLTPRPERPLPPSSPHAGRRPRRCARLLAAGFALAVALAQAGNPHVGRAAPALEGTLLDGTPYSLAQQRGHVVLVNFWATWCTPCRDELKAFTAYYRKHAAEGLEILAVSVDEEEDDAKMRRASRQLPFHTASARNFHVSGWGRIWQLPTTFVVDRGGILRVDGGARSAPIYDEPTLERQITPLLQPTAPQPHQP